MKRNGSGGRPPVRTWHEPDVCERSNVPMDTQYTGKGWTSRFRCASCGRTFWQSLNFLGRRIPLCNGLKIAYRKPGGPTAEEVFAGTSS